MSKPHPSASDRETALDLLGEGATQREVADLLDITQATVSRWATTMRPEVAPGKANGSRPGLALKRQQAIALALDGVGIVAAAEQTGQSAAAFSAWFKAHHPKLHALAQLAKKRRRAQHNLDNLITTRKAP